MNGDLTFGGWGTKRTTGGTENSPTFRAFFDLISRRDKRRLLRHARIPDTRSRSVRERTRAGDKPNVICRLSRPTKHTSAHSSTEHISETAVHDVPCDYGRSCCRPAFACDTGYRVYEPTSRRPTNNRPCPADATCVCVADVSSLLPRAS